VLKPIRFVCAVLLIAAVTAGPAAARSALPRIPGNAPGGPVKLEVKPAQIIYTLDGTGILGGFDGRGRAGGFGHLHWSAWTHQSATGRGADWIDNCKPNCASGRYSPSAATVTAFRPRGGHFTRMTLRVHQGRDTFVSHIEIVLSGGRYIYEFGTPG
jgi:hypothetical protein